MAVMADNLIKYAEAYYKGLDPRLPYDDSFYDEPSHEEKKNKVLLQLVKQQDHE